MKVMTLAFDAPALAKHTFGPVRARKRVCVRNGDGMTSDEGAGNSDVFGADIIAIARRADRAAFSRLFEHFAPRIKGFLMRGGADSSLAEDLVQEALLTVWRKASYFDPAKAGASTWIFTIVRNLRVDGQRRAGRQALYEAAMMHEEEEPPQQPDQALLVSERETRVRNAMRELPQDQLAVISLSFVDGKAHGEIAKALDIPLGTVKSRIRLAVNKLKGNLEGLE